MTRMLPVFFALAGLVASATPARAQQKETIPPGRIGARAAVRGSSSVGLGFTTAAVAGYHPTPLDKRVTFGAEWSLGWSYFDSDQASIIGSLRFLELDMGVRVRIRPNPDNRRFLVIGVGGALLRTNAPIAPDFKRSYWGPYVSVGFEPKVGKITLGIDARIGIIATGPTTISIGMTATLGN